MRLSSLNHYFRRGAAGFVLALGSLVFAVAASAQVNVFLDYSNFQTRLNQATASAGVANFNSTEVAQIQANVLSSLNTAFAGYNVNFTTSNPGGTFETIIFGEAGGGFGVAERIDYRNLVGNDTARVFTANFGTFIESSDSRALQIQEFSTSLAGTAAHELGHNVGLEHRDPYGIAGLGVANSSGSYFTGGLQNRHIMATGITGISEPEREVQRTFSDFSHVKLEFAQGFTATPLAPEAETGSAHGNAGTAQDLTWMTLLTGNSTFTQAAAVSGSIELAGEDDFYAIDLQAGDFLAVETISTVLSGIDTVDTVLSILDTDGTTVLATNDDTILSLTDINDGGSTYSTDSTIFNFLATSTGTYFVAVSGFGTSTGDYELLMATTTAIPEPGSLIVLGLIGAGALMRRRSQR